MIFMGQNNEKQGIQDHEDLGFGNKNYASKSRYLNPDGTFNIRRKGASFWDNFGVYHALITMSWFRFLILVVLAFVLVNALFSCLYFGIGVSHFGNFQTTTPWNDYTQLFFFSAQTLTTVGYGHIYPKGNLASAVAMIEAAFGLTAFALATGILYARFSRPQGNLIYSQNLLIAPYNDTKALMFRLANPKRNELIEVEIQVLLSMINHDTGLRVYKPLELELRKINFLALTWTVVHPLDEKSPLVGTTLEEYKNIDAEFLILIKAIDDTYEQTVHYRHSYTFQDLLSDVKFVPIPLESNAKGNMVLDLKKINEVQPV
ncbi:MAG: hypothetical protein EB023_08790 [Flavobacteriia bacterium]|nr:hypothetical protein [Flavobacteriia bacterium]